MKWPPLRNFRNFSKASFSFVSYVNGTPSLVNSRSGAVILEILRTNSVDALAIAKKNRTSSLDDGCVPFLELPLCYYLVEFHLLSIIRNAKNVISD